MPVPLQDYEAFKNVLVERGEKFGEVALKARAHIAYLGTRFIEDGAVRHRWLAACCDDVRRDTWCSGFPQTILVHGYTRVVLEVLKKAAQSKNFNIIVTEGRPDGAGYRMCQGLKAAGIPTTMVLDSAMG